MPSWNAAPIAVKTSAPGSHHTLGSFPAIAITIIRATQMDRNAAPSSPQFENAHER